MYGLSPASGGSAPTYKGGRRVEVVGGWIEGGKEDRVGACVYVCTHTSMDINGLGRCCRATNCGAGRRLPHM